jgi:hypothetical protein
MECLPPLMVSLLVAVPAVFGADESARLEKIITFNRSISRSRKLALAKWIFVGLPDLVGIRLARPCLLGIRLVFCAMRYAQEYERHRARHNEENRDALRKSVHTCVQFHLRLTPSPNGFSSGKGQR